MVGVFFRNTACASWNLERENKECFILVESKANRRLTVFSDSHLSILCIQHSTGFKIAIC